MIAYNNDPQLKADLLAEVHKHYLADQIVKGTYGIEDGVWKGCAVGCLIRSYNIVCGKTHHTWDHSVFEEFGIPIILAQLNDSIFEGLPATHNRQWPERFLSAINPGADLTKVWPKFAHWLMVDPEYGVIRFARDNQVREAIQGVADLYADGDWPSAAAVATAAATADAAANDADDAAAADAAATAAATATADAAAASRWSAVDAADDAHRNQYVAQADKLVALLAAAK